MCARAWCVCVCGSEHHSGCTLDQGISIYELVKKVGQHGFRDEDHQVRGQLCVCARACVCVCVYVRVCVYVCVCVLYV